jgi:Tol biopolymer transport system component
VSADGRCVAFSTSATNLDAGDHDPFVDVYVHDFSTGGNTRASVGSSGAGAKGHSRPPVISADCRFVAFESAATNLVSGDTNGFLDVFLHDRATGATTRVSTATGGVQAAGVGCAISADGRFVVLGGGDDLVPGQPPSGVMDVFVHEVATGVTTRVSVGSSGELGDDDSGWPGTFSLSGDGRYAAFTSSATNLVQGDTNCVNDVFVHDRRTRATTRVSVGADGSEGNGESYLGAISTDGRFVAFQSRASNLVPADTNGVWDVFLRGPFFPAGLLFADGFETGDTSAWAESVP